MWNVILIISEEIAEVTVITTYRKYNFAEIKYEIVILLE